MNKKDYIQIIQEFCKKVKQHDFNGAARIVEDAAKELVKIPNITPSSLEKLANFLKQEISDEIDLVEIRSEIIKLNIPYISDCVAETLKNLSLKEDILKLRKLIEALINFYKYYGKTK